MLKIKPKKSFFFQSSVLFLGHLLLKDGILPNPEKVSKVKDWPIPKTAKEVHSFLGLASHYRRFIPLFLGHLLLKDGILPNPEKVSKVKDWPIPKTAKEVHSFLGLASHYRRFIPQFAKWASPLHDLIRPIATTKKHARVKLPAFSS